MVDAPSPRHVTFHLDVESTVDAALQPEIIPTSTRRRAPTKPPRFFTFAPRHLAKSGMKPNRWDHTRCPFRISADRDLVLSRAQLIQYLADRLNLPAGAAATRPSVSLSLPRTVSCDKLPDAATIFPVPVCTPAQGFSFLPSSTAAAGRPRAVTFAAPDLPSFPPSFAPASVMPHAGTDAAADPSLAAAALPVSSLPLAAGLPSPGPHTLRSLPSHSQWPLSTASLGQGLTTGAALSLVSPLGSGDFLSPPSEHASIHTRPSRHLQRTQPQDSTASRGRQAHSRSQSHIRSKSVGAPLTRTVSSSSVCTAPKTARSSHTRSVTDRHSSQPPEAAAPRRSFSFSAASFSPITPVPTQAQTPAPLTIRRATVVNPPRTARAPAPASSSSSSASSSRQRSKSVGAPARSASTPAVSLPVRRNNIHISIRIEDTVATSTSTSTSTSLSSSVSSESLFSVSAASSPPNRGRTRVSSNAKPASSSTRPHTASKSRERETQHSRAHSQERSRSKTREAPRLSKSALKQQETKAKKPKRREAQQDQNHSSGGHKPVFNLLKQFRLITSSSSSASSVNSSSSSFSSSSSSSADLPKRSNSSSTLATFRSLQKQMEAQRAHKQQKAAAAASSSSCSVSSTTSVSSSSSISVAGAASAVTLSSALSLSASAHHSTVSSSVALSTVTRPVATVPVASIDLTALTTVSSSSSSVAPRTFVPLLPTGAGKATSQQPVSLRASALDISPVSDESPCSSPRRPTDVDSPPLLPLAVNLVPELPLAQRRRPSTATTRFVKHPQTLTTGTLTATTTAATSTTGAVTVTSSLAVSSPPLPPLKLTPPPLPTRPPPPLPTHVKHSSTPQAPVAVSFYPSCCVAASESPRSVATSLPPQRSAPLA